MNPSGPLPIEIVSLIVQHVEQRDLPTMALVNKSFYTTINPLLWRTLIIHDEATFNTIVACLFRSHLPLSQHVRQLHFDPIFADRLYHTLTDTLLMLFIKQLPQLEELVITRAHNITDTSFQHVPRHCPHLTSIKLRGSLITTPLSIAALGQYGHHLRRLTLEISSELSLATFATLATCPMLQELSIEQDGIDKFEDDLQVDSAVLEVAGLHRLTHLALGMDPTNSYYFSHQIILKCTDAWPQLTHFSLQNAHTVNDCMVMAFLGGHPHLQHFSLEASELTDKTMDALARLLPDITSVGLTYCENLTYRGLRRLVRHCRQLKQVVISDSGFRADRIPEASEQCLEWHFNGYERVYSETMLEKLDQDAIDKIRLGPGEPDDNDTDSDDDSDDGSEDDVEWY